MMSTMGIYKRYTFVTIEEVSLVLQDAADLLDPGLANQPVGGVDDIVFCTARR